MEAWRIELYASNDELYHHGILGMKWGVRRYQNKDGSYTSAGRRRYDIGGEKKKKKKEPNHAARAAGVAAGVGIAAGVAAGASIAGGGLSRDVKQGKGRENTSVSEESFKKSGEAFGSASNVVSGIQNIKKKQKMGPTFSQFDYDLSKKNDKQLKSEINRMADEVRWDDLNQQIVNRGQVTAQDYLTVTRDVVATVASVVTIASLIYNMKHPRAGG